jgi:phage-related holin
MNYNNFNKMPIDTTDIGMIKSAGYGIATALGIFFGISGVKQEVLNGLIVLMLIDTATGVLKYLRVSPKEVKSKTFSEGVIKKLIALFIPLTIGILMKTVGLKSDIMLTAVFLILCLNEAYSTLNNLHSAYDRKLYEEYDAVSALLKFTKDNLYNRIRGVFKQLKQNEKSSNLPE